MPFPFVVAAAVGCCSVSGVVRSADGAALRAHLHVAGATALDADSDARGSFAFSVPAGFYRVTFSAAGYSPAETDIVVHDGEHVDVALEPLCTGRLRQIGQVSVDGRLSVTRATVPSREITRIDIDASGYDRVIDVLANVPSLSLTRPDAGTASATTRLGLGTRYPTPFGLVARDALVLDPASVRLILTLH